MWTVRVPSSVGSVAKEMRASECRSTVVVLATTMRRSNIDRCLLYSGKYTCTLGILRHVAASVDSGDSS